MCVIGVWSPGIVPKKVDLENACKHNPDGFGWAVIAGDRIIRGHSMNATAAVQGFLRDRWHNKAGFALFHARIATHGTTSIDNCHPFVVGGDPRTVLAHNGILHVSQEKGDQRSDSRYFAEELLPDYGIENLDGNMGTFLLEEWMIGSKVVVLTVDPVMEHSCYILNERKGKWEKDEDGNELVWWSNDSWKPRKPVKAYTYEKTWPSVHYMWKGNTRYKVTTQPDGTTTEVVDPWPASTTLLGSTVKPAEVPPPLPAVLSSLEAASVSNVVGTACPVCEARLSEYSRLHELCEDCFTCLRCNKTLMDTAEYGGCDCFSIVDDNFRRSLVSMIEGR